MVWNFIATTPPDKAKRLYDSLPDECVVAIAKDGNNSAMDYLIYRYRSLIERKATSYYFQGAERDDILQEGMIGLYKAIRDYRAERNSHFSSFAELCVTRQIVTAIKSFNREKHLILNSSVSLDCNPSGENGESNYSDLIADENTCSPELLCVSNYETNQRLERAANLLSPLEHRVLQGYISGETYQTIQESLGVSYRCIDNALQRIKKKLSQYEGS